MSELLEKYDVVSMQEYFETMLLALNIGAPLAFEMFEDLQANNCETEFKTWYSCQHLKVSLEDLLTQLNPTA